MIGRGVIALVLSVSACGDDLYREDLFEPVSGSRLKLEWFLYDDATRQAAIGAYYDTELHARCAPRRWVDDVVRCVPLAEEAVYIDADCANVIGRASITETPTTRPTVFIGYDRVAGTLEPARLYRAGAPADTAITQYFEKVDGVCTGPFFEPSTAMYFNLVDEVRGIDVVAIRDVELGQGRLALHLHESDDGLRAPIELVDRELGTTCTPRLREDGTVCEPVDASPTTLFGDPGCVDPVIAVPDNTRIPTIATETEASGCPSYRAVRDEVPPVIYQRVGERCVVTTVPPSTRLFAVGPKLELPTMDRAVEDVGGRRLQRIILSTDDLRFVGDHLHDSAIRAECRRFGFADVTRCIPAALATSTTLFKAGCVNHVRATEISQPTCERAAFATEPTGDGFTIHAIGDVATETLYRLDGAGCQPYAPTPGTSLRLLGPPLPPEAFVGAVVFGER